MLNFSREAQAVITKFHAVVGDNWPTNLPDMPSLVASGRLQNVIKYSTKEVRKMGPAGRRVE